MTNPNKTLVVLLLDRSGSMGGDNKAQMAVSGVNSFVEAQKAIPGDVDLFYVPFNHYYNIPQRPTPLQFWEGLTMEGYQPTGYTHLLECIQNSFNSVGSYLAALPEADRPGLVVVGIMTDGEQNPPRPQAMWDAVRTQVQHQAEQYNWKVMFLAAGLDARAYGEQLGVRGEMTMSVSNDGRGVKAAYAAMSHTVSDWRSGNTDATLDNVVAD